MLYKWELKAWIRRGHRFYLDHNSGRYAMCDESGRLPQSTDDGVIWLNTEKSLVLESGTVSAPGIAHQSNAEVSFFCSPQEAEYLIKAHGMSLRIGNLVLRPVDSLTPAEVV